MVNIDLTISIHSGDSAPQNTSIFILYLRPQILKKNYHEFNSNAAKWSVLP